MSDNAQKPVIKISEILAKLASGVSRKQIAAELGVSYASAQKNIFSHPKLKNRKTRPAADFVLQDDTEDAGSTAEPVSTVVEEPTPVEEVVETVAENTSSQAEYLRE